MAVFELPPVYEGVRAEATALAEAVAPFAAEADECSEAHPGTLAALRDSRLCELMVPAAYGGASRGSTPSPSASRGRSA